MIGERSLVASGPGCIEQGGYLRHQHYEKENWSKSFVHESLQQLLGWEGNDPMWQVPKGIEQPYKRMYNSVEHHISENYILQDRLPVFPVCHHRLEAADRNLLPALTHVIPYPQYAKAWPIDTMSLGLVSEKDRVGTDDPIPYSSSTNPYLVSGGSKNFGIKTTTNLFFRHAYETPPNTKISNAFALPYSRSSQYVKPGGNFSKGQTLFTTNTDRSFHESASSRVAPITPYGLKRNAPLPVIQLPFKHCFIPNPYPPGFKRKQNAQILKQNISYGNFFDPQRKMVLPGYIHEGNSHHLYQTHRSNGMQHNSRVKDCPNLDSEAVTVPRTLGNSEIPPWQWNVSAVRRKVSPRRRTSSRRKKEERILKMATISPRPSTQQSNKSKNQFATSAEPLTQCPQQRSVKGKSIDLVDSHSEYDLADAPIFQILCEIQ